MTPSISVLLLSMCHYAIWVVGDCRGVVMCCPGVALLVLYWRVESYVGFLSPRVVARGGGQAPEKRNRQVLPSRLSPAPAVSTRSPARLEAGMQVIILMFLAKSVCALVLVLTLEGVIG
jgi:hypothetical protein